MFELYPLGPPEKSPELSFVKQILQAERGMAKACCLYANVDRRTLTKFCRYGTGLSIPSFFRVYNFCLLPLALRRIWKRGHPSEVDLTVCERRCLDSVISDNLILAKNEMLCKDELQ